MNYRLKCDGQYYMETIRRHFNAAFGDYSVLQVRPDHP